MSKQNLFDESLDCLKCQDVEEKLHLVQQLVQRWHQGLLGREATSDVEAVKQPGVPAQLKLVHPSQVPRRRLGSREGRIALLHAVVHIEFTAINLALDAVYRFRNMPKSYYDDWLRVASEECYHFNLIRLQLRKMGVEYGDLPAHQGLWDVAMYSAGDVLTRMSLVPRVLEARGLDVTPTMIERVSKAGDVEFAEILKIIFRDEIGHVGIGSFWFNHLCKDRHLNPLETFDRILQDYRRDMNAHINGPFEMDARLQAGFTSQEMDCLNQYA